MKKLLAISLAALLTLSLSVTAFADIQRQSYEYKGNGSAPGDISPNAVAGVWEIGYVEDDGLVDFDTPVSSQQDKVFPGKTVYYPLVVKDSAGTASAPAITAPVSSSSMPAFVTKSDSVKSISVRATWDMNKDAVESAKVIQKKYGFSESSSTTGYAYFLAVTMRSSTSTAMRDVAGDVVLRKTSGSESYTGSQTNNLAFEIEAAVRVTAGYLYMADRTPYTISSEYQVFEAKDDSGEQSFEFYEVADTWFDVDVTGQGKILVKADNKYNSTVANKYPAANLDFFNGSGTFNKIGTLRLGADPGTYLYVLNSDGTLSASNAEYDSYEEAFLIKTRTLGNYVISDRQLDVASVDETPEPEPSAPAPVEPSTSTSTPQETGGVSTPKPNPGTGVAA